MKLATRSRICLLLFYSVDKSISLSLLPTLQLARASSWWNITVFEAFWCWYSHLHNQVLHNMYLRTAPIIIDNFSFYSQRIDFTSTLNLTCASISCFESAKLEFYSSHGFFFLRFIWKHRNVSLIFSKLYFSIEFVTYRKCESENDDVSISFCAYLTVPSRR